MTPCPQSNFSVSEKEKRFFKMFICVQISYLYKCFVSSELNGSVYSYISGYLFALKKQI
jgi:hypothetical protein